MSRFIPVAVAALVAVSSSGIGSSLTQQTAAAQSTPPNAPEVRAGNAAQSQNRDDKIRLESKLVSLTVTASDRQGRFVTGLDKEHFAVYDDKVKQEIAHFSDEDAPLTLGIIYDVSGSMSDLTSRSFQALRRFFETSHEDDDFFIIAFNDRPQLVQDFTISPNEIMNRVVFIKAKGNTALYDAVYVGVEKARQGRHPKKALLILSDGEENNSRYSGGELRELLKEADVPVYSIGISELFLGSGILKSISGWSGGHAFFPMDYGETGDVYTRIAVMLRHQYVIGFYPTDANSSASWHKVQVTINAPKSLGRLTLSYKKGYPSFR